MFKKLQFVIKYVPDHNKAQEIKNLHSTIYILSFVDGINHTMQSLYLITKRLRFCHFLSQKAFT